MSNYNEERGRYVIPSAEWADLKRAVRDAYNALQERRYEVAIAIWNRLREAEDPDFEAIFEEESKEKTSRRSPFGGRRTERFVLGDLHFDRRMIEEEIYRKDNDRVYKPRKKAFPKKTNRDTRFDLETLGRPHIRFDNDSRTVYWRVHENNRAVEDARSHPVAEAFFSALGDIDWTRQSGGKIKYQDEYQKDAFQGPTIKDRHGSFGERRRGPAVR
jgi:hypothetical protein